MTDVMRIRLIFLAVCGMFCFNFGCRGPEHSSKQQSLQETSNEIGLKSQFKFDEVSDFIPTGYVIVEKIYGDLNKDGRQDCVIIIKGTDQDKIIQTEYRGVLDRNRRGIIVIMNNNDGFEEVVKNMDCFSSENEDGGVYYAPDLSIHIDKGNLYIHYDHGRYGYWRYTFRYQNSDLELIGYDASEKSGPVINTEVSINYLTKKMIVKRNTYQNEEAEDEVFTEEVTGIYVPNLIKLSEIDNFDELPITY